MSFTIICDRCGNTKTSVDSKSGAAAVAPREESIVISLLNGFLSQKHLQVKCNNCGNTWSGAAAERARAEQLARMIEAA